MIGHVTEAETRPADSDWASASAAPEAPPATTLDVVDPALPAALPEDRYLNMELS
jgi:hypothetical protein